MRVVVTVEQFDGLFSVIFPAEEANEKFLQIEIFNPAVNQLLNFTDWELVIDQFLQLVLVPIFSEASRKRDLLTAKLQEYVRVVCVHLGVWFFHGEVSVKKRNLKFFQQKRAKVNVPVSVAVHCCFYEESWNFKLIVDNNADIVGF